MYNNGSLTIFFRYCLLTAAVLSGNNVRAQSDEQMSIHYGRVTEEAQVNVKSHTGEGALIGGLLGAASSGIWNTGSATGNVLAGSATGAATGAAVEYVGEWRMKGMRYTIESVAEGALHIITDQTGVRIGDCVAIEATAKHANLRRVSDAYCETAPGAGDHHLDRRAQQAAADCHRAKKVLLSAEIGAELEQAKRRVRALCDT